jgi:hypothetical protein
MILLSVQRYCYCNMFWHRLNVLLSVLFQVCLRQVALQKTYAFSSSLISAKTA